MLIFPPPPTKDVFDPVSLSVSLWGSRIVLVFFGHSYWAVRCRSKNLGFLLWPTQYLSMEVLPMQTYFPLLWILFQNTHLSQSVSIPFSYNCCSCGAYCMTRRDVIPKCVTHVDIDPANFWCQRHILHVSELLDDDRLPLCVLWCKFRCPNIFLISSKNKFRGLGSFGGRTCALWTLSSLLCNTATLPQSHIPTEWRCSAVIWDSPKWPVRILESTTVWCLATTSPGKSKWSWLFWVRILCDYVLQTHLCI